MFWFQFQKLSLDEYKIIGPLNYKWPLSEFSIFSGDILTALLLPGMPCAPNISLSGLCHENLIDKN